MSTIELTALRVQPGDVDLEDALFRVQDLEGLPIDDSTWEWMLGLARMSVGGDASIDVDQDRRWGSVKVSSGSTLVDVLWQGNAVNLYYDVGLEPDDRFYDVLKRLRDAGYTIVQGSEVTEVRPSATVADMLAAQQADQGF
ncbi:MAG: hypothetical protein ACXV2I_10745 [Actinomycetes bacterium]